MGKHSQLQPTEVGLALQVLRLSKLELIQQTWAENIRKIIVRDLIVIISLVGIIFTNLHTNIYYSYFLAILV